MSSWLITGGSGGIGLAIGRAALDHGHKAILTTRNPEKAAKDFPEIKEKGGEWMRLDLNDSSLASTVADAIDKWNIDVLVNNAGVAYIGAVEDFSDEETHVQMDTNFYAPLRTMRAAIPKFRSRGGGTIVNIGSAASFLGMASRGIYAASKAALVAACESMADEIAPFNIRLFSIEPGAFQTNFAGNIKTPAAHAENGGFSEAYNESEAAKIVEKTRGLVGNSPGDPDKAAARIFEAVVGPATARNTKGSSLIRLILGSDSLARAKQANEGFKNVIDAMADIAPSTDFNQAK